MTMAPAFLLDASAVIFRYYFSMPDHWQSQEGYATAAVYGYTHWLRRLLRAERPSHIAACFDESLGSGHRHQLYPGYKRQRALPDDALAFQLTACRRVSELLGVSTFASPDYEADDLVGTLAAHQHREGRASVIVSRDKDLGQLLKPGDRLWHYPEQPPLSREDFVAKWGLLPEQLPDYLALVGDAVDDIPGVPGIGAKTARALLDRFGSVAQLIARCDEVATMPMRGARALAGRIQEHVAQIQLAYQLATICCDVPLDPTIARRPPDWDDLQAYTQTLGFRLNRDPDL